MVMPGVACRAYSWQDLTAAPEDTRRLKLGCSHRGEIDEIGIGLALDPGGLQVDRQNLRDALRHPVKTGFQVALATSQGKVSTAAMIATSAAESTRRAN
jgi:hypothetical protein